jgi:uncharacterized protein (DUF1499 family)
VKGGRLAVCPSTPNCVSSQSEDKRHKVPPLYYRGEKNPIDILKKIVKTYPKAKIITENEDYLHVEFRSNLFSFVDDAEFYYDKKKGIIHIRSAARMGYSDMGVNRKRTMEIEERFNKKSL